MSYSVTLRGRGYDPYGSWLGVCAHTTGGVRGGVNKSLGTKTDFCVCLTIRQFVVCSCFDCGVVSQRQIIYTVLL